MEKNINTISKAFHGRPRTGRTKKFYSFAGARECIGELSRNCEIFGLTKGQFSLFNIIQVVLEKTGPADVLISTWTAAGADTKQAKEFLQNGLIRKIRWIVDRSFMSRQPEYCRILLNEFGDCIRTIRTHAKFIVITNERWHFVIRTSMNLNSNPRIEDFEISEDREFADYFLRFADEIFTTHDPVDNFDGRSDLNKITAFDREKPRDIFNLDSDKIFSGLKDFNLDSDKIFSGLKDFNLS